MLFEKLIMKRIRDTNQPVTISTGMAFGHKILTIGAYKFIEIDADKADELITDSLAKSGKRLSLFTLR